MDTIEATSSIFAVLRIVNSASPGLAGRTVNGGEEKLICDFLILSDQSEAH